MVIIREGNDDKKTTVQESRLGYVCCLSCLDIASTPMKNPQKLTSPLKNSGWKTFAFPFEMAPFWGKFVHFRGLYPVSQKHTWREGIELKPPYVTSHYSGWNGSVALEENLKIIVKYPELLGR